MYAKVLVSCRVAATALAVQSYPGKADQLQFQKTWSALDSVGTGATVCFPTALLSLSRSKARLPRPPG